MTEEFVFEIASVSGGARLTFRGEVPPKHQPYDQYSVHVSITGGGVAASEIVYDHVPSRWTQFFEGLARDWRGWDGARDLETFEGQLRVSCTSDRTGHVEVRVQMRGDMVGSDWRAEETIFLEAGQLEGLAKRAKAYFGEGRPSRGESGAVFNHGRPGA